MPDKIYIYGDSLLKATVPDGDFHYHFHINEVMQRYQTKLVEVVNRSKMGATIRKGLSLVRHDLDRGLEARYALVSYGGNDSDFDWAAIDADPEADHRPNTELPEFADTLHETLDALRQGGVQPVTPGGGGTPLPHTAIRVPGHRPASRLGVPLAAGRRSFDRRGGWGFSVCFLHIE